MIKVSEGAVHISRYNRLILKAYFHFNLLYLESTEGAFETLIIIFERSYYIEEMLWPVNVHLLYQCTVSLTIRQVCLS